MAYKKAPNNSFAEYQLGEGFGQAVTGKTKEGRAGDLSIKGAAKSLKSAYSALPKGLKGYEGYPDSYAGYDMGDTGDLSTKAAASQLMRNAEALPGGLQGADLNTEQSARSILNAARAQGYEGVDLNTEKTAEKLLSAAKAQGYEGYAGVEDDAFAGYQGGLGQILSMKQASEIARKNKISDDVSEFSGLGDTNDLESWHSFYHKASLAKTDTDMLSALRKAVASVPDDTPASVKRSYYDAAMKLMRTRKNTDLRYLDIGRLEIDSNLGWLIDPRIPKTGGFDGMLNKVVGAVGAKLGKGDKDDLKMKRNEELGEQLKAQLAKTGMNLGDWSDTLKSNLVYILLGAAGIGAAYWYCNKKKTGAPSFKKKKKK